MDKLILQPTETAHWYDLINEAQRALDCQLDEDLESYLVFMLMRYKEKPCMTDNVLAMDFLHAVHATGKRRIDLLQQLGDKSLIFSGLFPDLANKRHVTPDYFVEMGRSAYYSIAELDSSKLASMFFSLAQGFSEMQAVLSAIAKPQSEALF